MRFLCVGNADNLGIRVYTWMKKKKLDVTLYRVVADDHFYDVEIPKVIYLKKWSSKSKFLRPFIFLKNIFSLLSVLRSGNYDILHAYNPSNFLCWIASIISNKPIVVITMGGDVLFEQHKCLFWYQKILVKLTLENSSLAIAKSPYIKKRVQQLCDTDVKVFSCIFGVSADFLLKKNTNKKETKELIFLSLRPIKSFYKIDKIIDVIHHIKKMQINVKLKIFTLAPDLYYLSFLKEKFHVTQD